MLTTVQEWLERMELDAEPTSENMFLVRYGSTVVCISIFEHQGQSFVRMAATMLVGIRPKLELLTRIFRLNARVLFGSFQLFDDETLCFTHTLLARSLDFETFEHALHYVGRVADDHDEAFQALGGGERMEEILDS